MSTVVVDWLYKCEWSGEKQGEKPSAENHYCCMLFMPREKMIHILRKRHKEASQQKQPSDWESWSGSNIWCNVVILHGWDTAGETVVYEQCYCMPSD
jgi:hypothetical protein